MKEIPTPEECVAVLHGYGLTEPTEESLGFWNLWRLGEYGYHAGFCSHPDRIAVAVNAARDELHALKAEARREFA